MPCNRGCRAVLLATLALATVAATSGSGCGSAWLDGLKQTTWEGKLRVQQTQPAPTVPVGLAFLTSWTYTRITMTPDAPSFTQLIIGQNIEDSVTCEYSCFDDKPVSHSEIQFDITGGKVVAGDVTPFATCPTDSTEPNMQLVALCSTTSPFSMVVKPYLKAKNGSWEYEVQFLGAEQPQQTAAYITCATSTGSVQYATQGFFRLYQPPQITAGWYKRAGTWILVFFFGVFASGWVYMFSSVKWNEVPEIPPDDESGGEDSEFESDSDSDSSGGSEHSGSGSEYETDSDDDGRGTAYSGSGTQYTDGHSVGASTAGGSVMGGSVVSGSVISGAASQQSAAPRAPIAFHCPNCGEGVSDAAATFCSHCGQPVKAPQA